MAQARAYFDTSAIVKRYVAEAGTPRARALIRKYRIVSSALTPIEALSAFVRRHAAGDLSERDYAAIVSRLDSDRQIWEMVELTPLVLGRAEELVRAEGLRTLDAIHVASALIVRSSAGIHLPFITGDARQRTGATRAQLEVLWVGT